MAERRLIEAHEIQETQPHRPIFREGDVVATFSDGSVNVTYVGDDEEVHTDTMTSEQLAELQKVERQINK